MSIKVQQIVIAVIANHVNIVEVFRDESFLLIIRKIFWMCIKRKLSTLWIFCIVVQIAPSQMHVLLAVQEQSHVFTIYLQHSSASLWQQDLETLLKTRAMLQSLSSSLSETTSGYQLFQPDHQYRNSHPYPVTKLPYLSPTVPAPMTALFTVF